MKKIIKRIALGITVAVILLVVTIVINIIILNHNESVVSKGQLIDNYSEKRCALLVVDIQEVITGSYSIYPSLREKSEELIHNINQAVDSFTVRDYPVVYIRSEITNPFINLVNNSYEKGSPGVQFDKRLKVVSELEVVKSGNDAFKKTHLDEILIAHKVNELYVVGLDAAECVNATVEASLNRGYSVNIIKEAVISKSSATTDSMMVSFSDRGVRLVSVDSLELTR